MPRVLACFMEPLLDGKAMQLVDGGHAKRTITSIHDASDALLLILGNPAAAQNQIFNVGNTENEVSIAELAVLMREIFADVTGDASVKRNPIKVVSSQQFYGEVYEDCDRRSSGYDQSNPVARLVADAVAATNLARDESPTTTNNTDVGTCPSRPNELVAQSG